MKKALVLSALIAPCAAFARDAAFEKAPYMDASLGVEARLDDLVSRMTLEEKIAAISTTKGFNTYEIRDGKVHPTKELEELYARFPGCGLGSFFRADWYSGRNWSNGLVRPEMMIDAYNAVQRYAVEKTRLGIPIMLSPGQFLGETTVPSGLGCAAMFDREALAAGTRMRIRERRTVSQNWGVGHPTADLALDPRWSRVEQTFGEDPYLSAEYSYVRARTAKEMGGGFDMAHFICHGIGEGGRMSLPAHVGDNEIYNLHMRPFEYGVKGGATSIMTCYNLVDGIPGIIRGDLVNGFIRGKLGYKGAFVGDAGAIGALVGQGFAKDLGEAAALAIKNGNDLCCWEAENYTKGLSMAFERGLVKMEELDVSVRRSLRGRFERGLFEHPYIDPAEWAAKYGRPADVIGSRENRDVVLDMARKAMTLLENKGGTLPLDAKKVRRLAVIGPNADKPENQLGDYTAPQRPGQTITPRLGFEALGKRLGFEVVHARGCKIRSMRKDGFAEAIAAAKSADAVVICLGGSSVPDQELTQNEAGTAIVKRIQTDAELDKDAGEGFDRAMLRLGGVQLDLLKAVKALGKPVVTVLIMGRPIVLKDVADNSDAVLLAWYPGTEGGTAVAETVFGLNNPGGRLPVSFPRAEGAIPCYYHALRNRGNYVDCEGTAAYPFGYGLSYTTFDVSKPRLSGNVVSVDVANTGKMRGDDVVQMYIHDVKFTVARPQWELRGFQRVTLEPGERKTVSFELTAKELGYWNRDVEYVVEPGDFKVAVWDRFEPWFGAAHCVMYTAKTANR